MFVAPVKKSPAGAIRSTPAVEIGYVEATDAEQAIKEAIKYYGITNPEHQQRLVAQRVK
jgi:hypothetical protein